MAKTLQGELEHVLERNIETLIEARAASDRARSTEQRIADAITGFAGSMPFVYAHAAVLAFWLVANMRVLPWIRPWDPYPFIMLAMVASVEAIFLSTFILVSQNRSAQVAEKRAQLDVQISLLTEHELTRLITVVDRLAERAGVGQGERAQLRPLEQDVTPGEVLTKIERAEDEEKDEGPR
jgi:uncharacterized membrane protein